MSNKNVIYKLLSLESELNLRNTFNKLKLYNTGEKIHKKQIEFHKCQKRNRWVFGGNRSGKTECGAVEALWLARGIHPYKTNKKDVEGWIVSVSYEVQREVAQAKILNYLNPNWIVDIVMQEGKKASAKYGVIDCIVIKNVFGGLSKICFKSCDQGREKFQGASLDFVWFDEEPPFDIYEECAMRVLDKKGEIFGTMTPLKGLTWVYDTIFLNKKCNSEIWHIAMEWADNPYLDKEEINLLASSMSEESLQSRRFGNFTSSSCLVYGEFEQSKHVIDPFAVPNEWKDNITIDPGLNNPLACLFCAVDYDGNIYVVGEHFEAGKDIDYHTKKIFDLAEQLDWHRDSQGRLNALIDSAACQHTLAYSKSVAEIFYENKIVVNTKVNKDIFSGIARIKAYFLNNKLFIFKNCTNLIRELKSYWWGNGDNPQKKDDHCLDALRYYVMTKPKINPLPNQKNIIEKDKEKIIRKLKCNK